MERTEEMDLESEIFNTHRIRYVLHYLWGGKEWFLLGTKYANM